MSKPSRDERWEARKRAKFSQENSLEHPQDPPMNSFNPPPVQFDYPAQPLRNYPETVTNPPYSQFAPLIPNDANPGPSHVPSQSYIPPSTISPAQSLEVKKLSQQQDNPFKQNPPGNSFFTNPVSEAEARRIKMQEEYRAYAAQDVARKRDEIYEPPPAVVDQRRPGQQGDEDRKRNYNLELQRQIQEREASKKLQRNQERAEEYFPFGKPGAGAPFRDSSGKVIATRPPKFNENDPNFNKPGRSPVPARQNNDYYPGYSQPPQYAPPNYQQPPQYSQYPAHSNYPPARLDPEPQYTPYPAAQYSPPSQYAPPTQYAPPSQYPPAAAPHQPTYSPPPIEENKYITNTKSEYEKSADALKKMEYQRALQEQIDIKARQKEDEKRRKALEERIEEERLAKDRMQMEEEFRREAEKKKKQINDLQAFNNGNHVVEGKKPRRPRTPIDLPPPEPRVERQAEEAKRRGQSAVSRSPAVNPNEIPQEYINYLNRALESKINEFRSEYRSQEIKHEEEMLKLRQKNQLNAEQHMDAQREIDRLKDELKRKQMEDDIRHRELAIALTNTKTVVNSNSRLPPYEPRPLILPKSNDDAYLSMDLAQRSLVSESKFIPLPSPQEIFPTKPLSPKDKKAFQLDSVFPSLPESVSNFDTYRSGSSSIGIDNILRKNEERLKVLDKFNPDAQDELNKLDEILFKFAENEKNAPEEMEKRPFDMPRKIETPGLFGRGELPSIKELDGEATYSLPDADRKSLYGMY